MKVFVTGGTGFVGRAVLLQLAAAGHRPVLLARHDSSRAVQELAGRAGAEVVSGDILDGFSLESIKGADAVIHLVGIIGEAGRSTFEAVHVRGTENVLAAARAAGVRRFVHMSALGTRDRAVSRYHQTKWEAEEAVRRSGLEYTIFRPSIIYGREDKFVNQFASMARWSPVLPVMGDGCGTFQPISVGEVATCFVRALAEPRSIGKTLDLAGPEVLTFTQVLDAILAATGRKRVKLRLPLSVALTLAGTLEVIFQKVLGKASPLSRDQVAMLQEKTVGDPRPAMELFQMKPARFAEEIKRQLMS